jgi:(2Fe-2S) ferredoxin
MTHYVTPYTMIEPVIKQSIGTKSSGGAAETEAALLKAFHDVIKLLLLSVDVDETWYRRTYPDVADAIEDGLFNSAKDHFVSSGYAEGRLPAELKVDSAWYEKIYPDVAESIRNGLFDSAAEHFRLYGYREGRIPFPL